MQVQSHISTRQDIHTIRQQLEQMVNLAQEGSVNPNRHPPASDNQTPQQDSTHSHSHTKEPPSGPSGTNTHAADPWASARKSLNHVGPGATNIATNVGRGATNVGAGATNLGAGAHYVRVDGDYVKHYGSSQTVNINSGNTVTTTTKNSGNTIIQTTPN